MGNLATPEALVARWSELCRDPSLADLPYKIELMRQLSNGVAISERSILARIGIRVADVVWASADFMAAYGEITPYGRAPEICVEIVSPSNRFPVSISLPPPIPEKP